MGDWMGVGSGEMDAECGISTRCRMQKRNAGEESSVETDSECGLSGEKEKGRDNFGRALLISPR
jgi:hypothetical protein